MPRRLLAEFVGTALLVTVVVGSGIAAAQLSPNDVGLQLLENSTATVFGLAVLILLFGPVSGAHFNPVVSAADWLLGRRAGTGVSASHVAHAPSLRPPAAFSARSWQSCSTAKCSRSPPKTTSRPAISSAGIATAGLIALIFALARTGRAALSGPSRRRVYRRGVLVHQQHFLRQPRRHMGRMFSDTFAGIAPARARFHAAQIVGGLLGLALIAALYPDAAATTNDVVVPHHTMRITPISGVRHE